LLAVKSQPRRRHKNYVEFIRIESPTIRGENCFTRHSPERDIVVIDGIYAADDDGQPQFQVLPAPDDAEIARLTEALALRIRTFLWERGLGPDSDPDEADPLSRDEPWRAGLYAASVRGKVDSGANRRAIRHRDQIDPETMEAFPSPRCATVDGFSLHANIAVAAGDRARLERLARYCARGPLAMERLERLPDGRLLYRFKRAWRA